MFLVVLISNITGYLLPWDQLAFWAITICTGMLEYIPAIGEWLQSLIRGGSDIGPATLSIFFAVHTAVIPNYIETDEEPESGHEDTRYKNFECESKSQFRL
jgi:quinol-cytochrome oxidoreductase complex cytochrome b subunit